MNTAEKIAKTAKDAAEAMEMANAANADANQDWEKEATEFSFSDGSVLIVSGPDYWSKKS